jgi:hypothetical protein
MSTQNKMQSKRFVVRQSLIGKESDHRGYV